MLIDNVCEGGKGFRDESENSVSICGLDHKTIRKAIKIRQFYKSGEPYICKVCHVQLSSSEHVVETDATFVKFELMFNMSCEAGQNVFAD